MSKNKKKKKSKEQEKGILFQVDESLNYQYEGIMNEIEIMQAELKRAEKKSKKKAKKKMKKGNSFYPYSYEIESRKNVVKNMEMTNFFERAETTINDIKPICKIIARLVASLILAILSIDIFRSMVKPETLNKMNRLYNIAMSF